ncbi:MAG: family 78 glycoside hydrolase catalytic domain, partial [Planctomycetaceae bacterium]|nr:family 78 glycoside hydrolase catalytic domain [Planctomycetaceae bacterium]
KLVSQMMPPMRITEELKPISVTQVKPGVWVYDFGQNIVGWCRLTLRGPAGTEITLRHAETLQTEGPDKGMLYVANLRNAKCRDIYTLKGEGNETYQPRFTYHGFRYAEITGFPGRPNLDTLTGCAVSTDLPIVGKFECSNPLVNRIYKCIEWGVRGNYLSIPTDCPQRDERQGWQGDRAGESLGEMYMFDNYTLYAKWMKDIQDSQRDDGNLSDVCPNFWPFYASNVTWPSAFTIIPGSLYKMYGDERPIARHYEAMKKWMAHFVPLTRKDGTLDKDNYGDWCVPPERPELIHSQDPARKTSPGILATAYYANNLNLLAEYAEMLGKEEEAKEFRGRATVMTEAFNKLFYNAEKGQYDNGTQTSCVLPLAFGLVPPGEENKVFATLVNNIENVTDKHIGTGLIGGQWLNLVLSNFDRDDIAYTFVTNKTYPSWGYMVENGATTVWELWNGNTADPAMNSGNHVMLVGDLVIWLYRRVAGIPAIESAQDGVLVFTPNPGGGLTYAKVEYDSVYGKIKASWRLSGGKMFYDVTIPVGQEGKILLPTTNLDSVKEVRGRKIEKQIVVSGYSFGEPKERVLVEVPSGTYSLECEWK